MAMDGSTLSNSTNPYLIYPTCLFVGVSVCRLLPVASWKKPSVQPKNAFSSCLTSPSSRWESVLGRAYKEDEFNMHTSSEDNSSKRGKLIELFKRIQIEISDGEFGSEDDDKSLETFTDDDSSIETSVLEFLQQSSRKSKGRISNLKHYGDVSNHKRKTTKKEKPIPTPQPSSTTNFSRPPSNFVKKSPIPSLTPLRNNEKVVNNNGDSNSAAGEDSLKIEGMKLSELKELAKQRGFRGYSKLKKSELVQLLKS